MRTRFQVETRDLDKAASDLRTLAKGLGGAPLYDGLDVAEAAGDNPKLIAALEVYQNSARAQIQAIVQDIETVANAVTNAKTKYLFNDRGIANTVSNGS